MVQAHISSALEALAEQSQFPDPHGLHKERQGMCEARAGRRNPGQLRSEQETVCEEKMLGKRKRAVGRGADKQCTSTKQINFCPCQSSSDPMQSH